MERKLASVRIVNEIRRIEGADLIELAIVDGWQCVVKRDEFQVGFPAVYCEIDSFIPSTVAPFLTKPGHQPKEFNGVQGERLKTIRLRGQLSQGLLLGMSVLPSGGYNPGDDVSEVLGIQKWEKPLPAQLAGRAKGNFPIFIFKTDQERIQNVTSYLHHLSGMEFEASIKLDGSSTTFFLNEGEFGVCSRNLQLIEDEANSFWQMARKYNVENVLRDIGQNLAIQGELIGPGVNGNRERFEELDFFVYDVFDIDEQVYLTPIERAHFMKEFNSLQGDEYPQLKHVPIIEAVTLGQFKTVDDVLAYAEGPSINTNKREGVVFKSVQGRVSFKAIANSYLLSEKD